MRVPPFGLAAILWTTIVVAIVPDSTVTVTVTTTVDHCIGGPATQATADQPVVPGNTDIFSGTVNYAPVSLPPATPVPGPPITGVMSGYAGSPPTTTGGGAMTPVGPEVPHGTDTALSDRVTAQSQLELGAGQSGSTGQGTPTDVSIGTVPFPNSNSTNPGPTSAGTPYPNSLSGTPTPISSIPPIPSESGYSIKLDLRENVRVKITDGSVGPKASALAAAGLQEGPKVIELDAIKDQRKEIKFDLYTDRYEGIYLSTCVIRSSGGAQTYDASFTLQAAAYTGMSHGFIWLECGNDKFDPDGPPRIDLEIASDTEITFTIPAMFFGKPMKQNAGKQTLTFGGLVKGKREKLEFEVASLHPDKVRYNHKCYIKMKDSNQAQSGIAEFHIIQKGRNMAIKDKSWFQYDQQSNALEMSCKAVNAPWCGQTEIC